MSVSNTVFYIINLLCFGRFRKLRAMWVMAILVVEFSRERYKIRKVFGEKSNVVKIIDFGELEQW